MTESGPLISDVSKAGALRARQSRQGAIGDWRNSLHGPITGCASCARKAYGLNACSRLDLPFET